MSDAKASSQALPAIFHLPYDIILQVITHLSASDIFQLLSTSRSLYALTREDSIWRHLCARYGLQDVSHFGGRSFYTVYTGLLHTYGPLIGLWASDAPYIGNILEFHMDPGDEDRPGGIWGEVWRFRPLEPEEPDTPETVEHPTFIPVIWVGFDSDHMAAATHAHLPPASTRRARLFCIMESSPDDPPRLDRADLSLVVGMRQGLFFHSRDGQFKHPDFPGPGSDLWLDSRRPYPRLRPVCQELVDQTELVSTASRPRVPIVFTAPSDYIRPLAIAIDCPRNDLYSNRPMAGFFDIIPFAPHFYPLKAEYCQGIEPWSGSWTPRSLPGLWFGTYGPHGTECAHVHWDEIQQTLSAWKITGDENVPRGALTWEFDLTNTYPVPQSQRAICEQSFGDLDRCRLFPGRGTISARGYMPHQQVPCFLLLGVVGTDELRILWIAPEEDELAMYTRYRGRTYEAHVRILGNT